MSVKDDIINELGNIPLEVMKPADNTNYVQQQLEKDSWGRKLNTQTFKQFEDSINILKGSSMYTLNTMVELETFNTEILRLDNKNISQDLDINSKLEYIKAIKELRPDLYSSQVLNYTEEEIHLGILTAISEYNKKVRPCVHDNQ